MAKVLNVKDYGYKVPNGAMYVGRAMPRYNLRASKWGNPMTVREVMQLFPNIDKAEAHKRAVEWYRGYIKLRRDLLNSLSELRGKDLACRCAPLPCHADVLLELCNSVQTKGE